MSANEALQQLKRGHSLNCVTPSGTSFRIESRLSYGIAWYRTRPVTKGCLNRFSRLSDDDMLQWLGSVTIIEEGSL